MDLQHCQKWWAYKTVPLKSSSREEGRTGRKCSARLKEQKPWTHRHVQQKGRENWERERELGDEHDHLIDWVQDDMIQERAKVVVGDSPRMPTICTQLPSSPPTISPPLHCTNTATYFLSIQFLLWQQDHIHICFYLLHFTASPSHIHSQSPTVPHSSSSLTVNFFILQMRSVSEFLGAEHSTLLQWDALWITLVLIFISLGLQINWTVDQAHIYISCVCIICLC